MKWESVIARLHPTLDIKRQFIFFDNPKCATQSIQRGVLAYRCLLHKDNPFLYGYLAGQILEKLPQYVFKFTVIRDPWDRAYSTFRYMQREVPEHVPPEMTFIQFLRRFCIERPQPIGRMSNILKHVRSQSSRFFWEGEPLNTHVLRFETLAKDWIQIADKLRLKEGQRILPHRNAGLYSRQQRDEAMTPEAVELICEAYPDDTTKLGYSAPA